MHISPFDYPGDQIVTPRPGQALLAKRAVISAKYYRKWDPWPDPKTAKQKDRACSGGDDFRIPARSSRKG